MRQETADSRLETGDMRRMLFSLCRRLARHTIPVPTRPTHQRKQMPKLPLWRNPTPSSALMLVLFSHNFRRQKLESQFARFRVCRRVSQCRWTSPFRAAGAGEARNETTEPPHATAIAVAVAMQRETARAHLSLRFAPRRTGRRGAMTRRRRRIGG